MKVKVCFVDKPLLFASYKIAYKVAKMKKPHTLAETLIKPCALKMVKAILGEKAAKKTATDSFV